MSGTPAIVGRGRLEEVPPLPRAQPDPEGRGHARPPRPLRGVLGARGRVVRGRRRARPSASSARTARARARCSSAWPGSCGPTRGTIAVRGQGLGAARARRRVPPRAVGPRERLPQRLDPRAVEEGARRASSTRSSSSPASSEFIDTPVKNYSSGMYVRLGFSVAINVDPDILLVDEVLAVGDETFQRKCAEKFAELQRRAARRSSSCRHALGTMRTMCDQRRAGSSTACSRQVGPPGEVDRRRTWRRARGPASTTAARRALGLRRGPRRATSSCSTPTGTADADGAHRRRASRCGSTTRRTSPSTSPCSASRSTRSRACTSPGRTPATPAYDARPDRRHGLVDIRRRPADAAARGTYDLSVVARTTTRCSTPTTTGSAPSASTSSAATPGPVRGGVARRFVVDDSTRPSAIDARCPNPMTDVERRRILVATGDVVTARMAGPAIRAWQIASALAARARRAPGDALGTATSTAPTSPRRPSTEPTIRRARATGATSSCSRAT